MAAASAIASLLAAWLAGVPIYAPESNELVLLHLVASRVDIQGECYDTSNLIDIKTASAQARPQRDHGLTGLHVSSSLFESDDAANAALMQRPHELSLIHI